MQARVFLAYIIAFFFISTWWFCALQHPLIDAVVPKVPVIQQEPVSFKHTYLSLNREIIKKALDGDVDLMARLMLDWDIDAQMMIEEGYANIKRLPSERLLKSQSLWRQLKSPKNSRLEELAIDALGVPFDLSSPHTKILPHTFTASGIVLAICQSERIVALPEGFREQNHIYSSQLTDKIAHDFNRYQQEELFSAHPNVALVSPFYSHPATLNTLKAQGIPLYALRDVKTINDLCLLIKEVGTICHEEIRGELLSLFVEAAFNAIDNRAVFLGLTNKRHSTLVVDFHARFSVQGRQSLSYDFLKRMGIDNFSQVQLPIELQEEWLVPVDIEHLVYANPEVLYVIAYSSDALHKTLENYPALHQVEAIRQGNLFTLDESTQKTCSQYAVLAYWDLNSPNSDEL